MRCKEEGVLEGHEFAAIERASQQRVSSGAATPTGSPPCAGLQCRWKAQGGTGSQGRFDKLVLIRSDA
jgi:hypothetical protein